jgi:hypothetical protein
MDERDYGRDFKENLEQEIRQKSEEAMQRPKVMLVGDLHWGFAWGLIILSVGVAWLLYDLGVFPFNPVARYWPLLLIVFGIMNLLTQSGRFLGLLLILAGAFLQLKKLGFTQLSFADIWPIGLIAVGLLLMWGSLATRGFVRAKKRVQDFRQQVAGVMDVPPHLLNAVAVFGGCERRVSSKNFQGGKATAVFGGVEMDFRDADMESEAILEVNCIFGGIEIRVPENWHVYSRNVPVFGGYEDTSRQPAVPPGATPKTLIVTGMVVFGGVEIKN